MAGGTRPLRVLILTTSYPRDADDAAGRFVADAVEGLRRRGVDVDVVSPSAFRHFGLAYGHGVVGNLRAKPWLVLAVPLFLLAFRRAAARGARDADLVHAHWLAAGAVAATLRRPFVVQVWGTDVELARRLPIVARWIFRRARVVVAASDFLAGQAHALGAAAVRVVPAGVRVPDEVHEPDDPPHVLYAGRLSPEKGIAEFLAATEGLPRVVVGAGPVQVEEGVGAVSDVGPWYERAAVVAVPSRREGYGVVAREAMAHGRPVVAAAVGGLLDAIDDGVNGVLVPPRDVPALRAAIERLLADGELRERLGAAARERARVAFSLDAAADALAELYRASV